MIRVMRVLLQDARTAKPERVNIVCKARGGPRLGTAGWWLAGGRALLREHRPLHAPPSSVPNAPARVTVKQCRRDVKSFKKVYSNFRGRSSYSLCLLQPLSGLWVAIVITLWGLFHSEFVLG
jgi:hypothetical protein